MYRILIADDEVHICQLIRHLVDWTGLNAQLCGIANDGVEAFELIRTQHPQIVISDIRMSGMDGISLLEQVRNEGVSCAFILVSGYREFDYAQRAIQLGVTDYLVKPINREALNRAVGKAIEKLQTDAALEGLATEHPRKMEKQLQQNLEKLRFIIETGSPALERMSLSEIAIQQGVTLPQQLRLYCYKLVCGEHFHRETLPLLQERVVASVEHSGWFSDWCWTGWEQCSLLASSEDIFPDIAVLQRAFQAAVSDFPHWRVLVSDCDPKINEPMAQSIRRAQQAVQGHYFHPSVTCFHASNGIEAPLRAEALADKLKLSELTDAMKLLDARDLSTQIQENLGQLEALGSVSLLFSYAGWLADSMNHALSAFAASRSGQGNIPYLHREELLGQLYHCPSLVTFCARCYESLEGCICSMREHIEQVENRPVQVVRDMVSRQYMEHLSLKDAADAVDLNPVYLSSLFKKETGTNFKDYLTNIRMEKAKKFLRQGESISKVSELVGYQDTKYFSKMFTRVVGVNPTQYKKLYR